MTTSSLFVAVGILHFLVGWVSASCFISPPLTETLMTGETRKTCEYNGVKLEIGSKFDTLSCERCHCTENGLHCCGFGYRAGVIATYPGCEIIGDGCDPISVKSCDKSVACETGRPILNKIDGF